MKLWKAILPLAMVSVFCLAPSPAVAQANSQLAAQVRQVLEENPDILLNVLRENGDILLDILQESSERRRSIALERQWREDAKTEKSPTLDNRPSRGPEDAPITLVAFSDFTCSYCQRAAITMETLLNRYPGQIRFVFKQVPASETARLASRWFLAALEQDVVQAWTFYALLFDRQQDLSGDPVVLLRELAQEAGLDPRVVEAYVQKNAKAIDELLAVDALEAKELGFYGTPHFLVNNLVIQGALPLENFVEAVEFALNL